MGARNLPRPEGGAFHSLRIADLSVMVRVGWSTDEREKAQELRLCLEVRFLEPPRATETDDLADTVCYGAIADAVTKHLSQNEFHLLEKVATDALRVAREMSGRSALVAVEVQKVNTPVKNLQGGAFYRCGDFPR